jgi:quercetin dioxygenase-like cupin family protein
MENDMTDHSLSFPPQDKPRGIARFVLPGLLALAILGMGGGLILSKLTRATPDMQMSAAMTPDGMADSMQMSNAAEKPITVTTISTEKLAHVPGKEVTVQMLVFKPGTLAPEHHHAGSVTVYVLAGTIRSQLAGEPAIDYHAGQSFFEPAGATHLFAQNPSATEDARIIAIHIADEGAQLTTYH